jgi:hypothetical protein
MKMGIATLFKNATDEPRKGTRTDGSYDASTRTQTAAAFAL